MRGHQALWAATVCVVATLLAEPTATAAPPRAPDEPAGAPSWLRLTAPPDCPRTGEVPARIVEWLGRPVPSDLDLDVEAAVTFSYPYFQVDLALRVGTFSGVRRIETESCAAAFDFIALTVVLAIDPTRSTPEVPPPAADTVAAPPPPPATAAGSDQPPEVPGTAHPRSNPPAPLAAAETARTSPRPHAELQFFAGGGAEVLLGILPSLRVGPTAALGVHAGRWAISLGGSYFPEVSEAQTLAQAPIAFSLAHARARGCMLLGHAAFAGGPCLHLDLGVTMAREEEEGGRRADEPYVALGGGGRVEVELAPFLAAAASAGLIVALHQPRFLLSDGTLVHQPRVGGSGLLELRLNLSRRVTKPGTPDTQ